jgi:hypothetical protein
MKNIFAVKLIAILFVAYALASAVSAQSKNPSYLRGIELFQNADYSSALDQFKQAAQESPGNVPVQLWLGLSYAALDNFDKPQDIWRAGIGDEKWENVVWALKGLAFWKQNQKNNAVYYFKQCVASNQNYQFCRNLWDQINNDEDIPLISDWAMVVGLQKTEKTSVNSSNNSTARNEKNVPTDESAAQTSGAKPSGGLWRGTISNGYKGQTLTFRVSADGKTISDITFQGYLQCTGSRIEDTQLAPLRNVAVSGGSFEDTQLNGGAKVRFDFNGTFTSATTASGTYRVMSDTDCDTYKLNWTATRVGN